MLTDGDYCVRVINLPGCIGGATRLSDDGFASVYINDQMSPEGKKKAFQHEIRHIKRNDFSNEKPIAEIEED